MKLYKKAEQGRVEVMYILDHLLLELIEKAE